MKLTEFRNIISSFSSSERPPVLFVGHGNPMNAITDNPFRKSWEELGKQFKRPKAILCISAHWYTRGTFVTVNEKPRTIHDFGGFPDELYAQQYPAPGAADIAFEAMGKITKTQVEAAYDWGLDHGTWGVLKPMFPAADIPVFQMSIDHTKPPEFHYELGRELNFLRDKGVMIVGSGNIVHNLRLARWNDPKPFDWAVEFADQAREKLLKKDDMSLIAYEDMGQAAELCVPTNEHYLPLLYALGASENRKDVNIFNDEYDMASISMMSAVLS